MALELAALHHRLCLPSSSSPVTTLSAADSERSTPSVVHEKAKALFRKHEKYLNLNEEEFCHLFDQVEALPTTPRPTLFKRSDNLDRAVYRNKDANLFILFKEETDKAIFGGQKRISFAISYSPDSSESDLFVHSAPKDRLNFDTLFEGIDLSEDERSCYEELAYVMSIYDFEREQEFLNEIGPGTGIVSPTLHHASELFPFAIQPFYAKGDLFELLTKKERPSFSHRELVQMTKELITGLMRAHAAGIVHRDIKLLNVLVSSDNHASLCDFGFACRLTDFERLHGYTKECDISALGNVLEDLSACTDHDDVDELVYAIAQRIRADTPDVRLSLEEAFRWLESSDN